MQEGAGWVVDQEAKELQRSARALHIPAYILSPYVWRTNQAVHVCSQFVFSRPDIQNMSLRMSVDIFHGYTETNTHFRESLEAVRHFPGEMLRVRVSNSLTERWLLENGIPKEQIFRIPIGVHLDYFRVQSPTSKLSARKKLNIPSDAFVIGSFQKDGVGWGEGSEPKLIKGPDIFLKMIKLLKPSIPNLYVLLSGPARGYVKNGLKKLGIPYCHVFFREYSDIAPLYQALDTYIVSSRDEGGPKAVLESMASGIPLITTRVGQAADLVQHGVNGFMVEQEDSDALAEFVLRIHTISEMDRVAFQTAARKTAEENSCVAQLPLWRKFFHDYIRQ